ncbi:MAG: heavy-metal-associated domain-containing protein [Clostridiales bacterium]|nr:heavy-metal-associated domain-containing protein [Clostridiales bacterium]
MKSATLQLETLVCPSCSQKIEAALKNLDGVQKDTVTVSFSSSRARFDFDESTLDIKEAEKAVGKVGFEVLKTRVK